MKKLTAGICAIALVTGINAPVFGEYPLQEATKVEIVSDTKAPKSRNMTDTKVKPVFSKEKWDSLNDMQKEEIYRLKDVTIDVECQIIDKYIEFGIIDRESGDRVKAKKAEYKTEMRKSGKIPGYHERTTREKKFK